MAVDDRQHTRSAGQGAVRGDREVLVSEYVRRNSGVGDIHGMKFGIVKVHFRLVAIAGS